MSVFYNRSRSNKGLPVGSIIPWSGGIGDIPRGWLPCNGSESYRVSDYPLLYQIIGNTYGGVPNTNFRVPRLNTGTGSPMDIFKGHFQYLNNLGESSFNLAHKPEKISISDDDFWKNIGGSESGNKPGTIQTNWISTIDLVGEQVNVTNLVANYNPFAFIPGEVIQTVFTANRKLGDEHIPRHGHDLNFSENTTSAVTYTSRTAKGCGVNGSSNFLNSFFGNCKLNPTCTAATRAIPKNLFGTASGMAELDSTWKPSAREGTGNDTGTFKSGWAGGSGLTNRQQGQDKSVSLGLNYDGDGRADGDMISARGGNKRSFWSDLNPAREFATFSQVSPHNHSVIQYTFSSKYMRVINPGIVNDVRLNTVKINNETGRNYGTITANTATANLSMVYLIKAF